MTPFQEALLAIQIAVDSLHTIAKGSPEARREVDDALAQINHLGFDTAKSKEPEPERKPERTFTEKVRKPTQRTLFPS